jgi:hypothetical protein
MRKLLSWQTSRILLSAALVPSALAAVALSATQASAQPLDTSTTTVKAMPVTVGRGQAVTLTAEVGCPADPSGGLGVTFFDGPTLLATVPVDSSGDASLTTSFPTTGIQDITAAYNGNADCAASDPTTTAGATSMPILPGFLGIRTGDTGNNYNYNYNFYYTSIKDNNFTSNAINSYNNKTSIKSGYASIANSVGNKTIKKTNITIKKTNITIKKTNIKKTVKVTIKPKKVRYWS